MEFELGELENSADFILLGLFDCNRLGLAIDEDDDGNTWVHLRKLGMRLMAEAPQANACELTARCGDRPLERCMRLVEQ